MAKAPEKRPVKRSAKTIRRVAIIGGIRTPFCRSHTAYADLSNLDLLSTALKGLADKYNLVGSHIDEITGGSVVAHSRDWNIAREALLNAGFAPSTPGLTMQQACGTSLQGALGIAAKIAAGQIECGISSGADTTSDAPIVFGKKFAKRLVALSRARSFGQKVGTFKGFSFGELAPVPPSTNEARTGLSMGQHCELMAKEWGITRKAQDKLAYDSHMKASAAYTEGFMDDLLVQTAGIVTDNNMRGDSTLEKMASLRTVFDRSDKGTLTAANSTPLTDGASAVLLASEEWAKARGLPILAYLRTGATAANDFAAGDGLLMAPTIAVSNMLRAENLKLQDFDFYEIHEAFAAQVLCTLKAWESKSYNKDVLDRDTPLGKIDREKLNVKGSSLAVGHPFAATGARVLAQAAKLVDKKGSGRALVSVCTAGGMGVTAIVEK